MTKVLLHFPWGLEETVERGEAFFCVKQFLDLLSAIPLGPAPFLDSGATANLFQTLVDRRAGGDFYAPILRFLYVCTRREAGAWLAVPQPIPDTVLLESWKQALRDELGDLTNWRTPQIVIPEGRLADWHCDHEVSIQCEQFEAQPASGPHRRPISEISKYGSHPYMQSDLDPWDLRRQFPIDLGKGLAHQHPARLPRPPWLSDVPVERLSEALHANLHRPWTENGFAYFIPPTTFDPMAVSAADWRNCPFKQVEVQTTKGPKKGPVDKNGVVWAFDAQMHRHWDVQNAPPNHWLNVSYTGKIT